MRRQLAADGITAGRLLAGTSSRWATTRIFRARGSSIATATTPRGRHKGQTFPVPGNHEYETPGAWPYYEDFGELAGGPHGEGYYSFEVGDWHAVALNSNIAVGPGSPQAEWLRADLAASRARCTIAYWHHPLFSSGHNGDTPSMREFWRILYDRRRISCSAHTSTCTSGLARRIRMAAPIRREASGSSSWEPGVFLSQPVRVHLNSENTNQLFGVLKLTLSSDRYQWEFIPLAGASRTAAPASATDRSLLTTQ